MPPARRLCACLLAAPFYCPRTQVETLQHKYKLMTEDWFRVRGCRRLSATRTFIQLPRKRPLHHRCHIGCHSASPCRRSSHRVCSAGGARHHLAVPAAVRLSGGEAGRGAEGTHTPGACARPRKGAAPLALGRPGARAHVACLRRRAACLRTADYGRQRAADRAPKSNVRSSCRPLSIATGAGAAAARAQRGQRQGLGGAAEARLRGAPAHQAQTQVNAPRPRYLAASARVCAQAALYLSRAVSSAHHAQHSARCCASLCVIARLTARARLCSSTRNTHTRRVPDDSEYQVDNGKELLRSAILAYHPDKQLAYGDGGFKRQVRVRRRPAENRGLRCSRPRAVPHRTASRGCKPWVAPALGTACVWHGRNQLGPRRFGTIHGTPCVSQTCTPPEPCDAICQVLCEEIAKSLNKAYTLFK